MKMMIMVKVHATFNICSSTQSRHGLMIGTGKHTLSEADNAQVKLTSTGQTSQSGLCR